MQIQVAAHMTVSNGWKRPCVARETSSICCFLRPVVWSLPRWGEWPASAAGCKACQHTATILDKSVTRQQSETIQVCDTCFTSGFWSCQTTWQQTLSLEGLVSLLTLSVSHPLWKKLKTQAVLVQTARPTKMQTGGHLVQWVISDLWNPGAWVLFHILPNAN